MSANLRLHQLTALVAVMEHGSIRAAARESFISQAAMTKSLRQLEESAGVPLIVRSSRGVQLTEAGERLYARAKLIKRQLDLANDELEASSEAYESQIRFAITPYVTLKHLGMAFKWFRTRYPRTAIEVVEGLVSRTLPRLRDGSLDFALIADNGELPAEEFGQRVFMEARQLVVARTGHPIFQDPTPTHAATLEWILTGPKEGWNSQRVSKLFQGLGMKNPPRIINCETLAGMSLLKSTDVISVIPEVLLALPEFDGIEAVYIPGLEPPKNQLVCLTRPDVPLSPAGEYMVQCFMDACAQK